MSDPANIADALPDEVMPWLESLRGRAVVVKLGGTAMRQDATADLLSDVVHLRRLDIDVVLVHGGGPEISQWQQRLGMEPRFVSGLRVSDGPTMELARMILCGKVGPELVSTLHRLGVDAVGISGEDGPTIIARARPWSGETPLGFVGDVAHIETAYLRSVLDNHRVPVIASIGIDDSGQAYNINADTAAAEIAVALDASVFVLVTDTTGVRDADGAVVAELDPPGALALIASGVAAGGMIPKLEAALRGLAVAERSVILDGSAPHALISALVPNGQTGTTIRSET